MSVPDRTPSMGGFMPTQSFVSVPSLRSSNAIGAAKKVPHHYSRSSQSFAYFRQQRLLQQQRHAELQVQIQGGIGDAIGDAHTDHESTFPNRTQTHRDKHDAPTSGQNRVKIQVQAQTDRSLPRIGHGHSSFSFSTYSDDISTNRSHQISDIRLFSHSSVLEAYAIRIQRWFRKYRDYKLFKKMKRALRAAEKSVTSFVLQQLNPAEAKLITDPSTPAVVRLRFWGSVFPPTIVYKVYLKQKVNTLDVDKYFGPGTNGLRDAMRLMGQRTFRTMIDSDPQIFRTRKETDIIQKGWRPLFDSSMGYERISRPEYALNIPRANSRSSSYGTASSSSIIPRASSAPGYYPPSTYSSKENEAVFLRGRSR